MIFSFKLIQIDLELVLHKYLSKIKRNVIM